MTREWKNIYFLLLFFVSVSSDQKLCWFMSFLWLSSYLFISHLCRLSHFIHLKIEKKSGGRRTNYPLFVLSPHSICCFRLNWNYELSNFLIPVLYTRLRFNSQFPFIAKKRTFMSNVFISQHTHILFNSNKLVDWRQKRYKQYSLSTLHLLIYLFSTLLNSYHVSKQPNGCCFSVFHFRAYIKHDVFHFIWFWFWFQIIVNVCFPISMKLVILTSLSNIHTCGGLFFSQSKSALHSTFPRFCLHKQYRKKYRKNSIQFRNQNAEHSTHNWNFVYPSQKNFFTLNFQQHKKNERTTKHQQHFQ